MTINGTLREFDVTLFKFSIYIFSRDGQRETITERP